VRPERVVADTTYGTVENIRALEALGIRAYVPLPDFDRRTPYYGKTRFTYDAERDEYRCPHDQPLRRRKAKYTEEVVVYQAAAATCNACPVKAQCTPSVHGRIVHRHVAEAYLDRVRAYHQGEPYAKAMRKRQVWVEPLFAEAKDWHGLRRFRLRGLQKVNGDESTEVADVSVVVDGGAAGVHLDLAALQRSENLAIEMPEAEDELEEHRQQRQELRRAAEMRPPDGKTTKHWR